MVGIIFKSWAGGYETFFIIGIFFNSAKISFYYKVTHVTADHRHLQQKKNNFSNLLFRNERKINC